MGSPQDVKNQHREKSSDPSASETQTRKIKQQRRWFEVTLASIGDGVITADVDGKVTMLNSIAEALTGWKNAEALGQPLEKVFHIVNEDTHAEVENPALRAIQDGLIYGLANHTLLIA